LKEGHLAPAIMRLDWPRLRPTRSSESIAAQVMPKLISVTAPAGKPRDSFTYWMKIGKVWKAERFAIVNSPITIASVRNDAASAAERMFGRTTRKSVVVQLAPRL